jgi:hypothetical protein
MRVCGCVCVVIGVYVVDCVSMFTRFSLLQRVCCKGRDRGFGLQRGAPLVLPAKSWSDFTEDHDYLSVEIQQVTPQNDLFFLFLFFLSFTGAGEKINICHGYSLTQTNSEKIC